MFNSYLFNVAVFYGSYLVFPFFALLYWFWRKDQKRSHKIYIITLFILSLLFVWARFAERQIILVENTEIEIGFKSKIVLIADLHLGVYKNRNFLERVVEKINLQNPDYVFIAGDFMYRPNIEKLDDLFKPLEKIKAPLYGVIGNHDHKNIRGQIEKNIIIKNKLIETLEKYNVQILENEAINLGDFILLGLNDRWEYNDKVSMLKDFSEEDKIIVLTHNPDTTTSYQNNNADLTLCGHTHGGQIRIPWIYKFVIPTEGNFDTGLSKEEKTKLFITSGLGEVNLPLRFLNPPTIDVLNLK